LNPLAGCIHKVKDLDLLPNCVNRHAAQSHQGMHDLIFYSIIITKYNI
jgi:hypothetical protein